MTQNSMLEIIKDTVSKIPGVKNFADYKGKSSKVLKTDDVSKAVEFNIEDEENHIRIHLILMMGVNIRNVLREIQYRTKFELEKTTNYSKSYIVDLIVEDLEMI